MTLINDLIHPSAVRIVASKSFLYATLTSRTKRRNILMLKSANKQPIGSEGVALLCLQIGNIRIHVRCRGVENRAVDSLLESLFIDSTLKEVFCKTVSSYVGTLSQST